MIEIMTKSIGNYKRVTIEAVLDKSCVNLLTSIHFESNAVFIPYGVILKISTSLNGLVSYYSS